MYRQSLTSLLLCVERTGTVLYIALADHCEHCDFFKSVFALSEYVNLQHCEQREGNSSALFSPTEVRH